jgi:hypothetical protein
MVTTPRKAAKQTDTQTQTMADGIPMEELPRSNVHLITNPSNIPASSEDLRNTSGAPSRRGSFLDEVRNMFTHAPLEVPLSPTTRMAANRHGQAPPETIHIRPIQLTASMQRELIKLESIEVKKRYRLIIVIDCITPTLVRLVSGFKEKKVASQELTTPGLGQTVEFELAIKPLTAGSVLYKIILEPLRQKIDQMTPIHTSHCEIVPIGSEGALSVHVSNQYLIYDLREFEVLEIYGPTNSLGTFHPSIRDLASESYVSINMEEKGAERQDCVICINARPDTLFLPCRHMCICVECASTMLAGDGKCPLCRQTFTSMMSIMEEPEMLTQTAPDIKHTDSAAGVGEIITPIIEPNATH